MPCFDGRSGLYFSFTVLEFFAEPMVVNFFLNNFMHLSRVQNLKY